MRRAGRVPAVLCWLLVIAGAGCAGLGREGPAGEPGVASVRGASPYHPDRRDYASFRAGHPGLLEPNYLPFMVHRFEREPVIGDALVFCRWEAEQMPIPLYIEPPRIAPELQDEFNPVDPRVYIDAAAASLAVWEGELEELVRFRLVEDARDALLRVRLIGEPAPIPVPERQRLGAVEGLADACRSRGWDDDADRMRVRFAVPEMVIHLADEHGLLPASYVRRLVLHELGHALGMRGHSPSPGDVMFPVLKDRPGRDELSLQDVNSFLNLYQLPNGAHLADLPPGPPPAKLPPAPPSGAPQVAMAPYVDPRLGFEVHFPSGWIHIEERRGVFVANGPSWDYDASLRIFFWPSPDIEHFLACCSKRLLEGSWLRHRASVVVNGRRTLKLMVEDPEGRYAQEYLFVELDDERVMLVMSESPIEYEKAWQPWFQACLNTLELWEQGRVKGLVEPAP